MQKLDHRKPTLRFDHEHTGIFATGYPLQYPLSTRKYPEVPQYPSVPETYWYQGTFSGTLASVHSLGQLLFVRLLSRNSSNRYATAFYSDDLSCLFFTIRYRHVQVTWSPVEDGSPHQCEYRSLYHGLNIC